MQIASLLLVLACGSGVSSVQEGAPSSRAAVVLTDEREVKTPPNPVEAVRELYGRLPTPEESEHDLFVFGPEGLALVGASVALVQGTGRHSGLEVLEVATSGPEGGVDLARLALADQVVVWADRLPATRIEGKLLREHRRLARGGALLVQLDPSELVTGRITIDGELPDRSLDLRFYFPWTIPGWPVLRDGLARVLSDWDAPGAHPPVRVRVDGTFSIEGFRWPDSSVRRVLPARIWWPDEDLFLADPSLADSPTRGGLRRLRIRTRGVPIELRLSRGGFVTGRVVGAQGESLGPGMELRFALGGEEERDETVPVAEDGSFRFAVPWPFRALDLELRSGALDPVDAKVFSFPEPDPEAGRLWDLRNVVYRSEHARLLRIRDEAGEAVAGAGVELRPETARDELPPRPRSPGWRARLSDGEGRLLARLPGPGERLVVTHPLYEPEVLPRLGTGDGPVDVVLRRCAVLHLRIRLPDGLPAERVLVQLEAARPALRLYAGDRSSYVDEARGGLDGRPLAERMVDANSQAPWSFTRSLRESGPRNRSGVDRADSRRPGESLPLDLIGITPGVPFHLSIFTPSGGEFLDQDVARFLPGEERRIESWMRADPVSVHGLVLRASGRPAARVNLHFGTRTLSFLARTDSKGRFEIGGLTSLEGRLLVESTSIWNACFGGGGGISGRSTRALFLADGFCFDRDRETVLQLPESDPLTVRILDDRGGVSGLDWRIELFDAAGVTLLTSSGWIENLVDGEDGEYVLARPKGVTATVVASGGGIDLRRVVSAGVSHLELRAPALGRIGVETGWEEEGPQEHWYWLTNQATGISRHRILPAGAKDFLEDILPGTYSLELRPLSGQAWKPRGPIEVTVQPNEIAWVSF